MPAGAALPAPTLAPDPVPMMSRTVQVEEGVREASFVAAAACRGEGARSEVAVERNHFWLRIKEELRAEKRTASGTVART